MTMGAPGCLWSAATWWARRTQSSRGSRHRRASWITGTARRLLRPLATPIGRHSTSCNKDWIADLNDTCAYGKSCDEWVELPRLGFKTAGYRRKTCPDRLGLLSDVLLVCCSWQLGLDWRRSSCRGR